MLKIITYRAETALADIIREPLGEHHRDEARAFIQKICTTEAMRPDPQAGILRIEIHSLSTPKDNRLLKMICKDTNKTQTLYHKTDLRLVFVPVSI